MSSARKYTDLPDLDDGAPDFYETPDLTDDTSTQRASSNLQTESPPPSDDEREGGEIISISTRRLNPDEARNQFLSTGQNGQINVKSRARSKRRPYRESSRRRDDSDGATDEDSLNDAGVESLEEKLARLQREVTEAKEELARREAEKHQDSKSPGHGEETIKDMMIALRQLNDSIRPSSNNATDRLLSRMNTLSNPPEPDVPQVATADGTNILRASFSPDHIQALQNIADFDRRLSLLETALGNVETLRSAPDTAYEKPIIPSIVSLDKQITLLSSTSGSTLDTASAKVKALLDETQKLTEARRAAKAAQDETIAGQNRYRHSRDMTQDTRPSLAVEIDAEQASKIDALYGTLPTIESLAPLLPPVLDRLKSLRTLHADAASASQNLSQVESRQDTMAGELKSWREGLDRLEEMMKQGEQTMMANMSSVEGWVKELEGRMK